MTREEQLAMVTRAHKRFKFNVEFIEKKYRKTSGMVYDFEKEQVYEGYFVNQSQ